MTKPTKTLVGADFATHTVLEALDDAHLPTTNESTTGNRKVYYKTLCKNCNKTSNVRKYSLTAGTICPACKIAWQQADSITSIRILVLPGALRPVSRHLPLTAEELTAWRQHGKQELTLLQGHQFAIPFSDSEKTLRTALSALLAAYPTNVVTPTLIAQPEPDFTPPEAPTAPNPAQLVTVRVPDEPNHLLLEELQDHAGLIWGEAPDFKHINKPARLPCTLLPKESYDAIQASYALQAPKEHNGHQCPKTDEFTIACIEPCWVFAYDKAEALADDTPWS